MDYFEITSPVAEFNSLATILVIVNQFDLEIHSVDVKGAYLNTNLDEEIYMKQLPGFDDRSRRVLQLDLNLYGIKQGGH